MKSLLNILSKEKIKYKINNKSYFSPSIVIKTPVTHWKRAQNWGDFHMAVLLKKQLEIKGYHVLIQILPEWDNEQGKEYEVVIVFRGLSRYTVKSSQRNIMWNISHPDDISIEEYEEYDHVFIASNFWAKKISSQVSTPVNTMLQCTDPERFYELPDADKKRFYNQLLFVGNSRGIYRKVLQDLLPTNYGLALYGKNWEKIIPKKYIKGIYIPNENLYQYYSSAEIVLNDHWDDMREKGFISNRIFDALACGAFIVTDSVHDMGELKDYVNVYDTKEELNNKIEYSLKNPCECKIKSQRGKNFVLKNHTFKQRAEQFIESFSPHLKASS